MTDTDAIARLARAADDDPFNILVDTEGRRFLMHRQDYKYVEITAKNVLPVAMPKLVEQCPMVDSAVSLIDYVKRFKNTDSVLFANIKANEITAVIDYHKGPFDKHDSPIAQLGRHRVQLTLPFSEQWTIWISMNNKLLGHVEFATFLEENAFDVANPAGADLFEMIRDIQVRQDSHFSSSIRMGDRVSVTYARDEDATTKERMELPLAFEIRIPIYEGQRDVSLQCYLRRRIEDGHLRLGYKMNRLETARLREFNRIAKEISEATEVPVFYGVVA